MSNRNPKRWLNSPFHVSEPSNNDLVFIVDNSGVVLTEVLPGSIRGIRDTLPDKTTKLKLAEIIVECLNTVFNSRQERSNTADEAHEPEISLARNGNLGLILSPQQWLKTVTDRLG